MTKRATIISLLLLIVTMFSGLAPSAGAEELSPDKVVQDAVKKVQEVARDKSLNKEERIQQLRAVVESLFDKWELSRRSFGRHWPKDKELQKKLVLLFGNLLEYAYFSKVEMVTNIEFSYERPVFDGDVVSLKSEGVLPNGEKLKIVYRMHKTDNGWGVYDLSVWDISLVSNYRSQFDKIINESSFDELIRRLEKKALK